MDTFILMIVVFGGGGFVWLCAAHRHAALALVFAVAPFPTELPLGVSVNVAIGELLAVIWLITELLRRPGGIVLVPTNVPVLFYLVSCFVSTVLNPRDAAVASILQMTIYLLIATTLGATVVRSGDEVRPALHGLLCGSAILSCIAMVTKEYYFLGLHKNAIGAAAAAGFLIGFVLWDGEVVSRRKKWYMGSSILCLGGLIMTASRGAWLGALVVVCALMLYRRRFGLLLRLAIIACLGVPLIWTLVPAERRAYALDLSASSYNVAARLDSLDFTYSQFKQNPFFGTGVGLRKEYDATNLMMTVLAETGVVGVLAFLLLIGTVLGILWRSLNRCRNDLDAQSLVFALGALFVAKLVHGMVDHYWTRGVVLAGWIGVGMAWRLGKMALWEELEPSELEEHSSEDDWSNRASQA